MVALLVLLVLASSHVCTASQLMFPIDPVSSVPLNATSRFQTHSLTFSSITAATLYINGAQKANLPRGGTTHVPIHTLLPKGTILTVVAAPSASGVIPGVLLSGAGVETNTEWRGGFTRKAALRKREWIQEFPFYAVCQWKRLREVDLERRGGVAFVWPEGTCGKDHVATVRYVVGGADGEVCGRPRPRKYWGVITVAAADRAWVFVNGRHIMDIDSKRQTKAKRVRLAKGDVISLKVMDVRIRGGAEFGFVVDVRYRGRRFVTTEGGEWRVTEMYKTKDDVNQFTFMRGGFDDCTWDTPVLPKYGPRRRAMPFPWKHGGKYVWARNAQREGSVVFARLVIEGDVDRCDDDEISGHGGGGESGLCDCEMVDSSKGSICFYFKDWRKHSCDDRQCEPKYVCTGKEATPESMLCMKKDISHRIVFQEEVDGEKICSLNKDPHHIYVPYGKDM